MPREDGPDPLAKSQGGVTVPRLARQQVQEPETTGEKADPLKVRPAVPDVLVVPRVSAGQVVQARHAAAESHVVANHVGAVAKLANGPLERLLKILVHEVPMRRRPCRWRDREVPGLRRSPRR